MRLSSPFPRCCFRLTSARAIDWRQAPSQRLYLAQLQHQLSRSAKSIRSTTRPVRSRGHRRRSRSPRRFPCAVGFQPSVQGNPYRTWAGQRAKACARTSRRIGLNGYLRHRIRFNPATDQHVACAAPATPGSSDIAKRTASAIAARRFPAGGAADRLRFFDGDVGAGREDRHRRGVRGQDGGPAKILCKERCGGRLGLCPAGAHGDISSQPAQAHGPEGRLTTARKGAGCCSFVPANGRRIWAGSDGAPNSTVANGVDLSDTHKVDHHSPTWFCFPDA